MTTSPTLLVIGQQMPWLMAELQARYALHRLDDEADPQGYLARHGDRFQALVTSSLAGMPAWVWDALPRLRMISNFGVGVDHIDLGRARQRGIVVGHTPDVLNDCVADLAMGLMLDVARRISAADRFVRAGQWPLHRYPLSTRVSGKRLGIVGLGRIGQVIARRASGFDMTIRYTSRKPVAGSPFAHEPDLLALAAWADFLVVATPGGAATHHLINAAVLQALGPEGFLINVARGSVVDEAALVTALQQGTIAGAGLDVFEAEPHVPQALWSVDNVVLLPHLGSATHDTRQAMAAKVVANLEAFFNGGDVSQPAA